MLRVRRVSFVRSAPFLAPAVRVHGTINERVNRFCFCLIVSQFRPFTCFRLVECNPYHSNVLSISTRANAFPRVTRVRCPIVNKGVKGDSSVNVCSHHRNGQDIKIDGFDPQEQDISVGYAFCPKDTFYGVGFPTIVGTRTSELFLGMFPFNGIYRNVIRDLRSRTFTKVRLRICLNFTFLLTNLYFPFFSHRQVRRRSAFYKGNWNCPIICSFFLR